MVAGDGFFEMTGIFFSSVAVASLSTKDNDQSSRNAVDKHTLWATANAKVVQSDTWKLLHPELWHSLPPRAPATLPHSQQKWLAQPGDCQLHFLISEPTCNALLLLSFLSGHLLLFTALLSETEMNYSVFWEIPARRAGGWGLFTYKKHDVGRSLNEKTASQEPSSLQTASMNSHPFTIGTEGWGQKSNPSDIFMESTHSQQGHSALCSGNQFVLNWLKSIYTKQNLCATEHKLTR